MQAPTSALRNINHSESKAVYPSQLRLKAAPKTKLYFTTINQKPAALVIDRLESPNVAWSIHCQHLPPPSDAMENRSSDFFKYSYRNFLEPEKEFIRFTMRSVEHPARLLLNRKGSQICPSLRLLFKSFSNLSYNS